MTERKPAGLPVGSWIEAQILKAQHEGKFDHLESAPDPLADIDEPYDPDWWAKKLIRREGLDATPEMLVLKRELADFRATLGQNHREKDLHLRVAAFNERIRQANLVNTAPLSADAVELDVERIVAEWRRVR